MPNDIQAKSCEPVVASAFENIDRCAAAENAECNVVTTLASGDIQWIQESLAAIVANQETIYNKMNESFASLNMVTTGEVENKVDEEELKKQQQKLELQAQIEALQKEMENL